VWDELRDCVVDLGYGWRPAETPRQSAARLARQGRLSPTETAALDRLAQATEKARYAETPSVPGSVTADLHTVRVGLTARVARVDRVRALLLPRSTIRRLGTRMSKVTRTVPRRLVPRRRQGNTRPRRAR